MTDFSELPTADQEAISKTLLTLLKAFDDRDAEPLRNVYSEDADWVNAFGTVKRGRDDIVEYLRGLLNDDNFNGGELSGPPETSFRVLTPDVVLVSAHLQVKGQGVVGGGTLDRDNFSLRALRRYVPGRQHRKPPKPTKKPAQRGSGRCSIFPCFICVEYGESVGDGLQETPPHR